MESSPGQQPQQPSNRSNNKINIRAIADHLNSIVSVVCELTECHRDPLNDTAIGSERANVLLTMLGGQPLPELKSPLKRQVDVTLARNKTDISTHKYAYRLYELLDPGQEATLEDIDKMHFPFGALFSSSDTKKEWSLKKKLLDQLNVAFEEKFIKDDLYQKFKSKYPKLQHDLVESVLGLYLRYARDSFFVKYFELLTLDVLEKTDLLDSVALATDCYYFCLDLLQWKESPGNLSLPASVWKDNDKLRRELKSTVIELRTKFLPIDDFPEPQLKDDADAMRAFSSLASLSSFQSHLAQACDILLKKMLLNKAILTTVQRDLFRKVAAERSSSSIRRWQRNLDEFIKKDAVFFRRCVERLPSPLMLKRALLAEKPFQDEERFVNLLQKEASWETIECLTLVTQRKSLNDGDFENSEPLQSLFASESSKDRIFLPFWNNSIKRAGPLDVDWFRVEMATGSTLHDGYSYLLRSPLLKAFCNKEARKQYSALKKKLRETREQKEKGDVKEKDRAEDGNLKMQKYARDRWSNLLELSRAWGMDSPPAKSEGEISKNKDPLHSSCSNEGCFRCDSDVAFLISVKLVVTHHVCQLAILEAEDVARKLKSASSFELLPSTHEEAETRLNSKDLEKQLTWDCLPELEGRANEKGGRVCLDLNKDNGDESKSADASSDEGEDRNDEDEEGYVDSEMDDEDGDDEDDDEEYSPDSKFVSCKVMCGKRWDKEYAVPKYDRKKEKYKKPRKGDLGVADSDDGSSCEEEEEEEERDEEETPSGEVHSDEDTYVGAIEKEDLSNAPVVRTRTRKVKAIRNIQQAERRMIEGIYYTKKEYKALLQKETNKKGEEKERKGGREEAVGSGKRKLKDEKSNEANKKQKLLVTTEQTDRNQNASKSITLSEDVYEKQPSRSDFSAFAQTNPGPSFTRKKKNNGGSQHVFSVLPGEIQVNVFGSNSVAYAEAVLML